MIEFISALYNEEHEVGSLIEHVYPYVDKIHLVDDESIDRTVKIIEDYQQLGDPDDKIGLTRISHSGLPEYVKDKALSLTQDGSWIIMLDADERLAPGVLDSIRAFYKSPEAEKIDYVYFNQLELIDGVVVRNFQKSKLFKKGAVKFQTQDIHRDDEFTGEGIYKEGWVVLHRKTKNKQVQREVEYLRTYKQLLVEGKIDKGRYEWLVGLHMYVLPHG